MRPGSELVDGLRGARRTMQRGVRAVYNKVIEYASQSAEAMHVQLGRYGRMDGLTG